MNSRPILSAARALVAPKSKINNLGLAARCMSGYKPPANWYAPTINELPVPQGSWQASYDAQQKKFNIHLVAGVSFFAFTLIFLKTSGIIFFNACIPELPEDE